MCSQPVAAEPGPPPPTGSGTPPGGLLRHAAWQATEAALFAAVAQGAWLVALLGGPGVGKTLMLEALERRLRADGLAPQRLDFGDLASGDEEAPVLLVDEAGRIDDQALAALAAAPDRVAVLAALPGFAARLEGLPHRVVRLPGLRAEDVEHYVAARLAALEVPRGRIGPDAVAALGLESAGVPRLLNVLIGSSLFTAGLEKAERVNGDHVRSAAGMHALSAVRVRVAEAPQRPPVRLVEPEFEPEPEPKAEREPVAAEAAMPVVAEAPVRPAVMAEAAPARSRGLLPWLAAGVVLGLIGAAGAWVMLGPGSGGRLLGGGEPELRPVALAQAEEAALPPPPPPPVVPPEAPDVVPALPVAPPARIVLTYPRGDQNAAQRGEALAVALRAAGRTVAAPFPVSQSGAQEVLRYFFLEDREMALTVGARAGQAPQAHRLGLVPDGAPLPRPGTVEWALPASGGRAASREAAVPDSAAASARLPEPPRPEAPAPGAVLAVARLPLEVELRWRVPAAATASPCCFVEVMGLEDGAWQEVFSGYALLPDRHAVPLTAARGYAWRVTSVSREGPRYAAGRWTRFTVQEGGE
jgi:hypothetical protein